MSNLRARTIFVTVGTTLFDGLIECVSDESFLTAMYEMNFRRVVIQFGKGVVPTFIKDRSLWNNQQYVGHGLFTFPSDSQKTMEWEIYRFKPSLEQDMNDAHLIISHAGAGSIMEGLSKCRDANSNMSQNEIAMKKLVVVINDRLMHNHQTELAEALEKRGYLFVLSSPQQLLCKDVRERMYCFRPKIFCGGDKMAFPRLLNAYLGFET